MRYYWHWVKKPPTLQEKGVRLGYRTIFIFPEFRGLVYGLMAMVMIIGFLNFAINPAILLASLFISLLVVTLAHTHHNLLGLVLTPVPTVSVFAGERIPIGILVQESHHRPRFTLGLRSKSTEQTAKVIDLAPGQNGMLVVYLPPHQRGLLKTGRLTFFSRYPLGLMRAWTHFELENPVMVYPQPESKHVTVPSPDAQYSHGEQTFGSTGDDFMGLEGWREGDSLRKIHWKASARSPHWLVKQFGGGTPEKIWLCWEDTGLTEVEASLSRLCRWVLDADATHRPFGLKLPGLTISPGSGSTHTRLCLESLALFQRKRSVPL